MENNSTNRRNFLKKAGILIGAGIAAPAIGSVLTSCEENQFQYLPLPENYELDLAGYSSLNTVGAVAKIKITGKNQNKPLVIKRKSETEFSVMTSICPHQGCEVDLPKDGVAMDCPCHHVEFSADDGKIIKNPISGAWAGEALQTYESSYNKEKNKLNIFAL